MDDSSLSGFSEFLQIRFDLKICDKPNCRYNPVPVFRSGKLGEVYDVVMSLNESKATVIRNLLRLLTQLFLRNSVRPHVLMRHFESQRESLEQQFFATASSTGLPRGLRWLHCEWYASRLLLRDRATNQPNLLVAINLRFEAIEGGDMENVAAVSNIRDACAVFQWQNGAWTTSGRTLFNMNPDEARERLAASYEPM